MVCIQFEFVSEPVYSLGNLVIVMRLSIQLILWNAVWQKFLAASIMASGARVANFENDIASQK